jgi:hypothetical protein
MDIPNRGMAMSFFKIKIYIYFFLLYRRGYQKHLGAGRGIAGRTQGSQQSPEKQT